MNWIFWILVLVLIWYALHRSGSPNFWKLASKHPDEAYEWFLADDTWTVFGPGQQARRPEPPGDYVGPFFLWIPKLGGQRITIYGNHERIRESQERFSARYRQTADAE
jgi:hypothetical protein